LSPVSCPVVRQGMRRTFDDNAHPLKTIARAGV
jgi:hypothetical protein